MTKKKTARLSAEDIDLLKNISVTGAVTYDFAISKIKPRRLRGLVETGILKKNKPFRDESQKGKKIKNLFSYSLGEAGIEVVLKRHFCSEIQGYNGYRHTECMQKIVDDLLNNKNIGIENIFNEKEQIKKFKSKISKATRKGIEFAVNDIAYYDTDNKLHSVEIVTDYRSKLINKHKNYARQVLRVKYESHKATTPGRRR